jgi:hypothetical protein
MKYCEVHKEDLNKKVKAVGTMSFGPEGKEVYLCGDCMEKFNAFLKKSLGNPVIYTNNKAKERSV